MRNFYKTQNTMVELIYIYHNATGGAVTPSTSVTITIYEGNSDIKLVDAQNMSVKNSITGLYTYIWDISLVANGNYNAVYTAINNALSYMSTEQVTIENKSVDNL